MSALCESLVSALCGLAVSDFFVRTRVATVGFARIH